MDAPLVFFDILFRHPERLLAGVFLAVLFVGLAVLRRRAAHQALETQWIKEHLPGAKLPSSAHFLAATLAFSAALILLAAAWAEPEKRRVEKETVYGQVRVAFLLDSSLSMVYADDVRPSRLAAAKNVIRNFIEQLWRDPVLKGRYKIALIPFAGAAMPSYSSFTESKEEFLWLLDAVNEKTITRQGTSFLAAFHAYQILLRRSPSPEPHTTNVIVVVSDGGKEDGIHSEKNMLGRMIFGLPPRTVIATVGIGKKEEDAECVARRNAETDSSDGNTVSCFRTKPVPLAIKDANGRFKEYLRKRQDDIQSPVLTSEIDESVLQFLATPTEEDTLSRKKNYHFFADERELLASLKNLVIAYRARVGFAEKYQYEPIHSWFLFPAFALVYFLFGFGGWLWKFSPFLYWPFKRLR